ncbi:MAG: polysaccharide biosynthesis protein [Planctomycetes bacterium]|nr:polysaccharide biosynthesis protein [Planctomycetota bacterium]
MSATSGKPSKEGEQREQPRAIHSWRRHHNVLSALAHAALFLVALYAAFGLAYNFHGWKYWTYHLFIPLAVIALPIKLAVFWRMQQFRGSWRFVGLRDLVAIAVGSQISSFFLIGAYFLLENLAKNFTGEVLIDRAGKFQQSVFLIDWAATINLVAASRVLFRSYYEFTRGSDGEAESRILIVGAGDHGQNLLREILRAGQSSYNVIGFVDDDVINLGHRIHNVEVLGRTRQIKEICDQHGVDELFIAMPDAKPKELRKVIELCKGNALKFRTIPAMTDLIEGRVQVSQLRPVDIEDLLGRESIKLDTDAIGVELTGKRIVVTGAGGSIGSEMCRQIARFQPERLLLIEQAENNLFEIHRELIAKFPAIDIQPIVADICDANRIRAVFSAERPSAVFHAAAHKHVPMMECNAGEAIKNNVLGTRTVALAASEYGIEKMVMISTDKAVNPTSVMGCSKRVAEIFVQQFGHKSTTQFVTVRFGNVLGSSGSVIPIFKQQIAKGGPVTVTHRDMTRYFMTIPEAAQLVLQAGTMGNGGEIFVLDMGDPIKIVDLAHNMITLSGLRPGEDIEIVFTGMRPGEKLFEELLIDGEHVNATRHPKIGIWQSRKEEWDAMIGRVDRLISAADDTPSDEIRGLLAEIVPEYQPMDAATSPEPRTQPDISASPNETARTGLSHKPTTPIPEQY